MCKGLFFYNSENKFLTMNEIDSFLRKYKLSEEIQNI